MFGVQDPGRRRSAGRLIAEISRQQVLGKRGGNVPDFGIDTRDRGAANSGPQPGFAHRGPSGVMAHGCR